MVAASVWIGSPANRRDLTGSVVQSAAQRNRTIGGIDWRDKSVPARANNTVTSMVNCLLLRNEERPEQLTETTSPRSHRQVSRISLAIGLEFGLNRHSADMRVPVGYESIWCGSEMTELLSENLTLFTLLQQTSCIGPSESLLYLSANQCTRPMRSGRQSAAI